MPIVSPYARGRRRAGDDGTMPCEQGDIFDKSRIWVFIIRSQDQDFEPAAFQGVNILPMLKEGLFVIRPSEVRLGQAGGHAVARCTYYRFCEHVIFSIRCWVSAGRN